MTPVICIFVILTGDSSTTGGDKKLEASKPYTTGALSNIQESYKEPSGMLLSETFNKELLYIFILLLQFFITILFIVTD